MYTPKYALLSEKIPEWGEIGVLPWDTEIFGFPVAEYSLGTPPAIARALPAWLDAFSAWTREQRVELVACSIPAENSTLRALVPRLGFIFVDFTFQIARAHESKAALAALVPLHLAQPSDQADLERIAEQAFRFGRYHADPYFPRELADRRYRAWVRNAIATAGPDSVTYVARRDGRAVGFEHIEYEGASAHVTILAIEKNMQGQRIAQELGDITLIDFNRRGIQEIWSSVSAINAPIVNHSFSRGYRVMKPQAVYHWHAPQAPHLISWDDLCARTKDDSVKN